MLLSILFHIFCLFVRESCLGKIVPNLNQVPRRDIVWGSGGIDPRIPNLGIRWRSVDPPIG